jgi:hypothetical protein
MHSYIEHVSPKSASFSNVQFGYKLHHAACGVLYGRFSMLMDLLSRRPFTSLSSSEFYVVSVLLFGNSARQRVIDVGSSLFSSLVTANQVPTVYICDFTLLLTS